MKIKQLLETDTSSDEFKTWFGKSQVGSSFSPKIVYHGTPDARDIKSSGVFKNDHSWRQGFFFSSDRSVAATYADVHRAWDYQNAEPSVIPVYLRLENPMIVDANRKRWRETEKHIDQAFKAGHDGIIIKNSYDEYNAGLDGKNGKISTVYVVFEPTQIKSPNNDGTFDLDDPNIFS